MRKETDRINMIDALKDLKPGLPLNGDAILAIQHVIVALCNLEQGIVDPIFIPNEKKANRPQKASIEKHNQAMASAAMGLFMKGGNTKVVAAKKVAKKLTNCGFTKQGRADKQIISAKTVMGWRDEIILHHTSKDTSRIHPLYEKYKQILNRHEQWLNDVCDTPIPPENYEAVAFALLDELQKLI